MLLVIVASVAGFVFALLLLWNFLFSTTTVMRTQTVAEAAALAAANELSRVVIDDPHFGYVSLSEAPPVKSSTRARDGEPLPVSSINAILAGIRQEMILADLLHNDFMRQRAKDELSFAKLAARHLEANLAECLQPNPSRRFTDLDGVAIEPFKVARKLVQCSQNSTTVRPTVLLRLGWDDRAGTTLEPAAKVQNQLYCKPTQQTNGYYNPSADLLYDSESFYLASVGNHSELIGASSFRLPDGIHLCSVVQAEVTFTLGDSATSLKACAQPGILRAMTPAGSLIVDSRDSQSSSTCLSALLKTQQTPGAGFIQSFSASGGDFPSEATALSPLSGLSDLRADDALGLALCDWLRSARARLNLDSLLVALDTRFSSSHRYCRYDIGHDGQVLVSYADVIPFRYSQVSENQLYGYSPQVIIGGDGSRCSITLFDNVYQLGNADGGKHAGQAIEGEAINWMQLPRYGGTKEQEWTLQRGSSSLGIYPIGDSSISGSGGIAANERAFFASQDGVPLKEQPRRSYLCGGLAVLIQLSRAM
jgi:hypothetical protein